MQFSIGKWFVFINEILLYSRRFSYWYWDSVQTCPLFAVAYCQTDCVVPSHRQGIKDFFFFFCPQSSTYKLQFSSFLVRDDLTHVSPPPPPPPPAAAAFSFFFSLFFLRVGVCHRGAISTDVSRASGSMRSVWSILRRLLERNNKYSFPFYAFIHLNY